MSELITDAKLLSFIMENISYFEPQDIEGDDVELRFELDGVDTGTDISLVEQCRKASGVINALIAALEQKDKYIAELRSWNAGLAQESYEQQQSIAELEASQLTVKLHKRSVGEVMHMSGFNRDYAEGWCAGNDNAIHEIRAAGIAVQGDE